MPRSVLLLVILQALAANSGAAEDQIWTSKPVRVDPSKQSYERLPRLMQGLEGGESITFPLRLDMHDSTRFLADGIEYQLADLTPVASNRLCKSATGARWPCGTQSSIFVSSLFRGKTLVCKVMRQTDRVRLSGCRTTRLAIPQEIVAQGFAFPSGADRDLQAALLAAKSRRAGVWGDAGCSVAAYSC